MVKSTRIKELTEFSQRWRRWTQVVRLFALQHRQRHAVEKNEYEALHAGLLQFCRAMVAQDASFQATHSRDLEEILAPWVSLESLAHADCVIVGQLSEQCEWVQRILDGRREGGAHRRWARRFLLGAAWLVATSALLVAFGNDQSTVASALRSVGRWLDLSGSVFTTYGADRSILIVGMAVVAATICVVWRSARQS